MVSVMISVMVPLVISAATVAVVSTVRVVAAALMRPTGIRERGVRNSHQTERKRGSCTAGEQPCGTSEKHRHTSGSATVRGRPSQVRENLCTPALRRKPARSPSRMLAAGAPDLAEQANAPAQHGAGASEKCRIDLHRRARPGTVSLLAEAIPVGGSRASLGADRPGHCAVDCPLPQAPPLRSATRPRIYPRCQSLPRGLPVQATKAGRG